LLSEPIGTEDSFSVANAKRLYTSCMDEVMVEERGQSDLIALINKQFGGWPILKEAGAFRRGRQQLLEYMIALRKVDSPMLFELIVSYNPKDPKQFILRVYTLNTSVIDINF
jgi:hypothetical protein